VQAQVGQLPALRARLCQRAACVVAGKQSPAGVDQPRLVAKLLAQGKRPVEAVLALGRRKAADRPARRSAQDLQQQFQLVAIVAVCHCRQQREALIGMAQGFAVG
jgi:hypothetical protein